MKEWMNKVVGHMITFCMMFMVVFLCGMFGYGMFALGTFVTKMNVFRAILVGCMSSSIITFLVLLNLSVNKIVKIVMKELL